MLYQDRNLISFPVARRSSNSSSNIPRCDANELILFYPPWKWFPQNIFGRVIHRNNHKYLPCSLLSPFSLQSRLISGWNRSLRHYLAISSVIRLDKPLFYDNSIAEAQPDESTGLFGNSPQFLNIYAQMRIWINILFNNELEEGEWSLIGSHFHWISQKKKYRMKCFV